MSTAKVIEISSESTKSFDDAVSSGIQHASKTVKNIKGVWVKDMKAKVQDGKVTHFRVDMKVTFVLDN